MKKKIQFETLSKIKMSMKTYNNGQQELAMMVNENFLNIFLYKQLMYKKKYNLMKKQTKGKLTSNVRRDINDRIFTKIKSL